MGDVNGRELECFGLGGGGGCFQELRLRRSLRRSHHEDRNSDAVVGGEAVGEKQHRD